MVEIRIPEAYWASSILPEGMIEKWRVGHGEIVSIGDPIAEVRIKDALHEIASPATGRVNIASLAHAVVEPGTGIGWITTML